MAVAEACRAGQSVRDAGGGKSRKREEIEAGYRCAVCVSVGLRESTYMCVCVCVN